MPRDPYRDVSGLPYTQSAQPMAERDDGGSASGHPAPDTEPTTVEVTGTTAGGSGGSSARPHTGTDDPRVTDTPEPIAAIPAGAAASGDAPPPSSETVAPSGARDRPEAPDAASEGGSAGAGDPFADGAERAETDAEFIARMEAESAAEFAAAVQEWRDQKAKGGGEAVIVEAGGVFTAADSSDARSQTEPADGADEKKGDEA